MATLADKSGRAAEVIRCRLPQCGKPGPSAAPCPSAHASLMVLKRRRRVIAEGLDERSCSNSQPRRQAAVAKPTSAKAKIAAAKTGLRK